MPVALTLIVTFAQMRRRDQELVWRMHDRIQVKPFGDRPEYISQGRRELSNMFMAAAARDLSVFEQDLFRYFADGDGRDVDIVYTPDIENGMGHWRHEPGRPDVSFGKTFPYDNGLRGPFELLKHELSHCERRYVRLPG